MPRTTRKRPKLGTGARFRSGVKSIQARNRRKGTKKVRNPRAVMAAAGRKKYGKKRFPADGRQTPRSAQTEEMKAWARS